MTAIKRVLMMLALCLWFFQKAEAATTTNIPDGLLIGDNRGIRISKEGHYFFDLENLLPGDRVTRKLVIQNNREDDYELKLDIQPKLTKGPVNLIDKIEMTFESERKLLYQGNLVTREKGQTAVKTVVDFGLIQAGSQQEIVITLQVKTDIPWEDLRAGESEAVVTWVFKANRDSVALPQTSQKPASGVPVGGALVGFVIVILGVRSKQQR